MASAARRKCTRSGRGGCLRCTTASGVVLDRMTGDQSKTDEGVLLYLYSLKLDGRPVKCISISIFLSFWPSTFHRRALNNTTMKALAILLARANFTCLVAAQFQLASARGAQPCKGVEFSLAMEIYVGEISAFLSLNVISDSTYTLALVAESLDTCPRIPVYVNTTSPGHPGSTSQPPAGALNFDLTNSSTAPEVKTRGVYGIIMPTPADKSPGSSLVINALWGGQDFGWFVDAIISRMYYAFTGNENQNFFGKQAPSFTARRC